MSILIGAGQRYDRIIGVGGITWSADGYLWSDQQAISQPFPAATKAQGIAADQYGTVFVAISDSGLSASSNDLSSWQCGKILDGNFTPLGISWGLNGSGARPVFAAAGSRIYNDDNTLPGEYELNDQVAQILINESGSIYTWDQAFTHPYPNSWFHNVRYFTGVMVNGISTNVWVAVGHVNGQPDIWYSEDINWDIITGAPDTATWQQVSIPGAFVNRPLYDVAYSNGRLYFSGRGVVINTDDLGDPTWDSSPFLSGVSQRINPNSSSVLGPYVGSTTNILFGTNFSSTTNIILSSTENVIMGGRASNQADMVSIASNPDGHLAAASSGAVYYSKDGLGWNAFSVPGYFFRSVIWFQDHWVAGAYSSLTQHTYWTSTNGTDWLPWNNGVQMYGLYASDTIVLAIGTSTSQPLFGSTLGSSSFSQTL